MYASLELDVTYDDGYAAYLNGVEVSRRNLVADAGPGTLALSSQEARREVIDLSEFLEVLQSGSNCLSIQVHNQSLRSSDLTMHPVLRAGTSGGVKSTLIASRALWYYRKSSDGPPPADWTEANFNPGASRVEVSFSRSGTYRFGPARPRTGVRHSPAAPTSWR